MPSGAHSGWTIDSSGPPAASIASPSVPSASNAATRSSVASQGMSGWSHSSQASRVPSGDSRGAAMKSEPLTSTCGSPPSSGMVTMVLAGSASHGVVLADGVEAAAGEVRPEVGVAPRTGRRDRHRRLGARIEPVEPAIGELGEDDDPADDDVRTAAVLVDPRSDIERRRRQVGGRAVRGGADEDAPAVLGGPALDPEDVVAVDPRLVQQDDVADDVLDPDRRAPRSIRCDDGLRLWIRSHAARRRRTRPVRRSSDRARCRARRA